MVTALIRHQTSTRISPAIHTKRDTFCGAHIGANKWESAAFITALPAEAANVRRAREMPGKEGLPEPVSRSRFKNFLPTKEC